MGEISQMYENPVILMFLTQTLLTFFFLKRILQEDNALKILILCATLCLYNNSIVNLNNTTAIDIFFMKSCQYLIYLLGTTHFVIHQIAALKHNRFILKLFTKTLYLDVKTNHSKENSIIKVLLIQIVLFTGINAIIFIKEGYLFNILFQNQYLIGCIGIICLSLGVLYVCDQTLKKYQTEEIFIRKLFHLGPLLVVPFIHYLNSSLLQIVLHAGFYLFFSLELFRYLRFQNQSGLNKILKWMQELNTREKHFWFTHLFLILSLTISYSFKSSKFVNQLCEASEHAVLILIMSDGMAALIGRRFGRIHIYKNKTLEGSIAFVVSFWIGMMLLHCIEQGQIEVYQSVGSIILIGGLCGLAELVSGDADNIMTILVYLLISYYLSEDRSHAII